MSKVWTNKDVLLDEKLYIAAMREAFDESWKCQNTVPLVSELAEYARKKLEVTCKKTTGWLSTKTAGMILRRNGFHTHHTRRGSVVTLPKHRCDYSEGNL